MKVESIRPPTAAEVRAEAVRWYECQIAIARRCLGSDWPAVQEHFEGCVKSELRERLLARGWRPRDGTV